MKKLLLLLGIVIILLSSCQRDTTTYLYRVQFVTSNAKTVVADIEKGTAGYGSYSVGDTVHVTRGDSITTDGRYRKAIVIDELGIKF